MSYNKYQRLVHQVSTDGGRTWTTAVPVQYARGELIERNSLDCQPSYRWVVISDEFICAGTEGYDKYEKLKKQVSLDGGTIWTDVVPLETKAGNLIQRNSVDCGAAPEYKWEVDHNRIVCDGTTAYYALVEYVSYDNRTTWTETGNVQKSNVVYQENYPDCIQTVYRWIDTGNYVCVGTSKYAEQKQQVSYNSGTTWQDTGSTRAGSLIEANSVDCGATNVEWVNVEGVICELRYAATFEEAVEVLGNNAYWITKSIYKEYTDSNFSNYFRYVKTVGDNCYYKPIWTNYPSSEYGKFWHVGWTPTHYNYYNNYTEEIELGSQNVTRQSNTIPPLLGGCESLRKISCSSPTYFVADTSSYYRNENFLFAIPGGTVSDSTYGRSINCDIRNIEFSGSLRAVSVSQHGLSLNGLEILNNDSIVVDMPIGLKIHGYTRSSLRPLLLLTSHGTTTYNFYSADYVPTTRTTDDAGSGISPANENCYIIINCHNCTESFVNGLLTLKEMSMFSDNISINQA